MRCALLDLLPPCRGCSSEKRRLLGAARGAHCRAQAAAVLALEHKDGSAARSLGRGHLSRASAIAVRICDENSALAPDTALDAMEADLP